MNADREIRIRDAVASDLDSIVKVHQRAFPRFLMTLLGPHFLRVYYRTALDYRKRIFVVATDGGGEICGFVVGFVRPADFYKLLRLRRKKMMLAAALYVAVRPRLWRRVLENMRDVGQRSESGVSEPESRLRVELASIGVDPDVPRRGYGKALMHIFLDRSIQLSATVIELTTDAYDNEGVNRFYKGLGFELMGTCEKMGGRCMNHYEYSLKL